MHLTEPLLSLDDGSVITPLDLVRKSIPGQPLYFYQYLLWNFTDYPFLEPGDLGKRFIRQIHVITKGIKVPTDAKHIQTSRPYKPTRPPNAPRTRRGH